MKFRVDFLDKGGKEYNMILEANNEKDLIEELHNKRHFYPLKIILASKDSISTSWEDLPREFEPSMIEYEKIRDLLDELTEGNLDVWDTLIDLLKKAESIILKFPEEDVRFYLESIHDIQQLLNSAGTPQTASQMLLERRLDYEKRLSSALDGSIENILSFHPVALGPGILMSSPVSIEKKYGKIILLGSHQIFFISENPPEEKAALLCKPYDILVFQYKGFCNKSLFIKTRSGKTWRFKFIKEVLSKEEMKHQIKIIKRFRLITSKEFNF